MKYRPCQTNKFGERFFFAFLISMRSFRLAIVAIMANDFNEIDLSIWQIIKAKRVTCWIVSTQRSNARLLTMCCSVCQGTKQRATNWQRYHFRSHRHRHSYKPYKRNRDEKPHRMSDREKKQIKQKKSRGKAQSKLKIHVEKSAQKAMFLFFSSLYHFISQ